jgi:hypothetical protein
MSEDLTTAAPAVASSALFCPCAACGAEPAPEPSSHCWWCGEKFKPNNEPMKLKDLIIQLLKCDMNADVLIHSANGSHMLRPVRISDCKERVEGDRDEPRVCIMCYDQEPCAMEAAK